MIPHTHLITPQGFDLGEGAWISLDRFCRRSQNQRNCYAKYSGNDLDLDRGCKRVRFLGIYSRVQCQQLFGEILKGFPLKKYWTTRKGHQVYDTAGYFTRDGERLKTDLHATFSGSCGPDGLMGIPVMLTPLSKVNGASHTLPTVCR